MNDAFIQSLIAFPELSESERENILASVLSFPEPTQVNFGELWERLSAEERRACLLGIRHAVETSAVLTSPDSVQTYLSTVLDEIDHLRITDIRQSLTAILEPGDSNE